MPDGQNPLVDGNILFEGLNIAGLIGLVKFFSSEQGTTTVTEFFASLETAASLGQWTDEQKISVLKARLVNKALKFFEANKLGDDTPWEAIKTQFFDWFKEPSHNLDPLHAFFQTTQRSGETAKNFVIRLKTAGNRASSAPLSAAARATRTAVVQDSLKEVFTNNLRDESGREHLINFPPADLEAAVTFATRYEENARSKRRVCMTQAGYSPDAPSEELEPEFLTKKQNHPSSSKAENKLIAVIENLEKAVQKLNTDQTNRREYQPAPHRPRDTPVSRYGPRQNNLAPRDRDFPPLGRATRNNYPARPSDQQVRGRSRSETRGDVRPSPQQSTLADIVCYRCGSKGHYAPTCNAPRNEARSQLNCTICQRAGHSRRECHSKTNRVQPNGDRTPIRARANPHFPTRSL